VRILALAAVLALLAAPAVQADTAPIANTPDLPWTNPDHQSNLEQLLGPIASHIAGRDVTVRCEGDTDWVTLVQQGGGDPSSELGYVRGTLYNSVTGKLVSLPTFTELDGSRVCLPLKQFASATTKPTKCAATTTVPATFARTRMQGRTVLRVVRPAHVVTGATQPCYLGNGKSTAPMTPAFWATYAVDAWAILTLAHESVHLSGVVGGTLSNGLAVGDQQAEAKADCYGMQWMPYVAEQLGDTPDDAQAIAQYFWDVVYPTIRTSPFPQYWSADCTPGGAMDIRPAGSTAWP